MYTLRTVLSQHTENQYLGRTYGVVTQIENPDEFNQIVKDQGYNSETIFGFIYSDETLNTIALLKDYKYYVMTENGKTFSNLSYK